MTIDVEREAAFEAVEVGGRQGAVADRLAQPAEQCGEVRAGEHGDPRRLVRGVDTYSFHVYNEGRGLRRSGSRTCSRGSYALRGPGREATRLGLACSFRARSSSGTGDDRRRVAGRGSSRTSGSPAAVIRVGRRHGARGRIFGGRRKADLGRRRRRSWWWMTRPDLVEMCAWRAERRLRGADGGGRAEGSDAARSKKPDVIVLDIMDAAQGRFPGLPGLKADRTPRGFPVIVLTAGRLGLTDMKAPRASPAARLRGLHRQAGRHRRPAPAHRPAS